MNIDAFVVAMLLVSASAGLVALRFKSLILTSILISVIYTLFKFIQVLQFDSASLSTSWASLLPQWNWSYLPLVLVTYLFIIPTYVLVKRFGNQFYLGSKKRIILGIGFGFVITLGTFFGMRNQLPDDPSTYVLTALTWSVLGGFVEEPLYRGALMTALTKKLGLKFSIPLQAIAFGLSHPWSLGAVLSGMIFGLFLGIIANYLGLWSSVAGHFLINLLTSNTMP